MLGLRVVRHEKLEMLPIIGFVQNHQQLESLSDVEPVVVTGRKM